MKLGKYLPAVLPVARSQLCNTGVFQVTCNTDLSIQIDVDSACLTSTYPGVSITDIQLSPGTPSSPSANTCTACTDISTCTPGTSFFGAADKSAPVISTTTSIYFNAGSCGAEYTLNTDEITFDYTTTIGNAWTFDSNNIMTDPAMPPTSFTCKYIRDIDGEIFTVSPVVMNDPTVDVIADPSPANQNLDPDNIEYTMDVTRAGAGVVLGSEVGITIVKIDENELVSNYYFESCIASNMATDDSSGNYKSFTMVTNGCPVTQSTTTEAAINVRSTNGKDLIYDQFGFIDTTDDSLKFHLSCDIRVGTRPSCSGSGRRRRNTVDGPVIKFEIDETVVDLHHVGVKEMTPNGIVYAVDQTPKASKYNENDENSSAAFVGASVMIAGANLFL